MKSYYATFSIVGSLRCIRVQRMYNNIIVSAQDQNIRELLCKRFSMAYRKNILYPGFAKFSKLLNLLFSYFVFNVCCGNLQLKWLRESYVNKRSQFNESSFVLKSLFYNCQTKFTFPLSMNNAFRQYFLDINHFQLSCISYMTIRQ